MKNGEQKDLGCNGKGRRIILIKVKKFREPAKMFVQCKGCEKCKRHLTPLALDAAMPPSAEPDSGLESVPAVESDTQPRK